MTPQEQQPHRPDAPRPPASGSARSSPLHTYRWWVFLLAAVLALVLIVVAVAVGLAR